MGFGLQVWTLANWLAPDPEMIQVEECCFVVCTGWIEELGSGLVSLPVRDMLGPLLPLRTG